MRKRLKIRGIAKQLPHLNQAIKFTAIILIFALALGIRMLPMKWGSWLTAYDPYFQYRVTEYIVENGFQAWFSWKDEMSWYPFGRNIPKTSYPGVPFTGAFFYMLAKTLGIEMSVMEICTLVPAILGALSAIIAYLIGREIEGEAVGIFSGLILATVPAFISRTSAGFYDTESVGFFAYMLSLYFWVLAMKRDSTAAAAISGAALAYMAASWGGSIYLLNLYALYAIVMVLLGKYSRRLLKTYSIAVGVSLLLSAQVPLFTRKYLISYATILPLIAMAILAIKGVLEEADDKKAKMLGLAAIAVIALMGVAALESRGYITALTGRILSVINPFVKEAQPLVASVAEHRAPTWGHIFLQYGAVLILAPLGMYFALKRGRDTDILLALGALTSAYFASTMIRLLMLAAPTFSILAAIGVVRILKPHANILIGRAIPARRGRKVTVRISRGGSAWIMVLLTLILIFNTISWRATAYTPPTIVTCGGIPGGTGYQDWIEALIWMRENLPEDAVVASWWDYGYWITALANKTSVIDNATLNATQIESIALAFMSNETTALKIFKKLGATHVVVFEAFDPQTGFLLHGRGYGDFAKSYWMIRIADLNESDYIKYYPDKGIRTPEGPKAANATLYRMLFATRRHLWKMWGIDIPEPEHFELVFKSSNEFVFVWKVLYEEEG